MSDSLLQPSLDLAWLCLQFGRVERATRHEDGVRPETGTDHTVMLAIFAVGLATRFAPNLNPGIVAQYALVHDLVEVYAGDTNTMQVLSEQQRADKRARECAAFERIEKELGAVFPHIIRLIENYEGQTLPEARYVRALDKVLPKLTHILNDCAVVESGACDFYHDEQRQLMQALAGDQPWLLNLWEQCVAAVRDIAREQGKAVS